MQSLRAQFTLDTAGLKSGAAQAKQIMESLRLANLKMKDAKLGVASAIGADRWKGDLASVRQVLLNHNKRMAELQEPGKKWRFYQGVGAYKLAAEYGKQIHANKPLIVAEKQTYDQAIAALRAYLKAKKELTLQERYIAGGQRAKAIVSASQERQAAQQSLSAQTRLTEAMQRRMVLAQALAKHQVVSGIREERQAAQRFALQERMANRRQLLEKKLADNRMYAMSMEAVRLRRASVWSPSPPVLPKTGLFANLKQRFSGAAGMQNIASAIAGGFGGGGMGAIGGAIFGPIGAAVGMAVSQIIAQLRRLFAYIKNGLLEAAAFAKQLRGLQSQTGITTKTGMVAMTGAELAGVDPNAVALEWGRFQANLTNIQKTTPQVSAALYSLGLNVNTIRRMNPDEQFVTIAAALGDVKNASNASAAALALFNRHGVELLRIFRDPMVIRMAQEMYGQSRELMAKNNGKLRDEMSFFGQIFTTGVSVKMRAFFIGMFDRLSVSMTGLAAAFNKIDFTKLGQMAGQVIEPYINAMARLAAIFAQMLPVLERVQPLLNFMLNRLSDFMRIGPLAFTPVGIGGLKLWDKIFGGKPKEPIIPQLKPFDQGKGDRLFDWMSVFGKGQGDQWSKIGAFSVRGGMNPIQAGLVWQQKIADNTRETARNTAAMVQFLVQPQRMGNEFLVRQSAYR